VSKGATLNERFREIVRRNPEAVALRDRSVVLSYAEVDRMSDDIAGGLALRGVLPRTLVGVSAARNSSTIIAILGVLKAGCGYVPLDPSYPQARLAHMLNDAEVKLVIATSADAVAPPVGVDLVGVDELAGGPPSTRSSADDLAYVIYTSGSTGVPKGVCVTHGNVASLIDACDALFDFRADDVWTLLHSFSFDVSVWEMWGALLHGATLVIVPDEAARSPKTLLELIASHQVTVFGQVPSAFRHLANEFAEHPAEVALRYLIFAGEPLDAAAVRTWLSCSTRPPKAINMYGITESTIHSSFKELQRGDLEREDGRTSIGVPLPHLQFHLLDEDQCPVADGQTGEIYVSGAGVTAGYWKRPELTSERFVALDGLRLYRSGDLAVRRADGEYDFVGRTDSQVKVRGFRIELGEIEAAVRTHPDVEGVVALVQESRRSDRSIAVAISYLDSSEPPSVAAWRSFLSERLPAHMLPSRYFTLNGLPLSPAGKLDRRAIERVLAEPAEAGPR
jgi:amino acid adenylation domain-containing protein